jgi:hypothetical protein
MTLAISHAFKRATCRPPTEAELHQLVQLSQQQFEVFQNDPEAARLFLESGNWKIEDVQLHSEAATLMIIANVLLNLDEVLVRG